MLLDDPLTTLEKWYEWASHIDKNYKKTQRMLGRTQAKTMTQKEEPKKKWNFSKQKDPTAMDIDAMSTEQQAEAMKKGLCFGCGKQGNHNADCPDKKGKKKEEEKKKWTSKELKEHVWALFNSTDDEEQKKSEEDFA